MDRYVISIGAGKNQLPLINKLVQNDYKVIGFDKNINAVGKKMCYKFNNISTWDYKAAISWLDSLDKKYEGVFCFSCGNALITQQKIISYYNLNCQINNDYINIIGDKAYLRKLLRRFKISNLMEVNKINDVDLLDTKKTLLIKDKSGIASNDISIVKNIISKESLDKILDDNYIVQEYIEGDEYRLIGLIQNFNINFIAVMKRENLKETFFTSRLLPMNNYDKQIESLLRTVISKFKIKDSVIKVDLIKNNYRMEILEIDFGIGGDYFESFISPLCYNYNFIDNYINLMLGFSVEEKYTINDNLCFDYIYDINKHKELTIDYDTILKISKDNFNDFELIKIKPEGMNADFPKSNMDAAFAIIHDRKDLTNYDINMLFNNILSK